MSYEKKAVDLMTEAFKELYQYGKDQKSKRAKLWQENEERKALIAAFAIKGSEYKEDNRVKLMIVGRAVGYMSEVEPVLKESDDLSNVGKEVEKILRDYNEKDMSFVKTKGNPLSNKNIESKKYYQLIKKVFDELDSKNSKKDNWYEYLVSSNLYKITYFNGRNPLSALARVQQEYMFDLLNLEIEFFKPTHVLFITDSNWSNPFIIKLTTNLKYKFCVCKRPERENIESIVFNWKNNI